MRHARHTSLVTLRMILRVRVFLSITSKARLKLAVSTPWCPASFDTMPRRKIHSAFKKA
jgi:hypothetical protein